MAENYIAGASRDGLRVTDGTSQEDRYPAALRDDYFHLDERPFADIVARTAEFAKAIYFYNRNNERSGDWRGLFAKDEVVAMAEIIATDYTRMEVEFVPKIKHSCGAAAQYLIRFARRIDRWYRRLSGAGDAGQTLSRAIIDWQMKAALKDVAAVVWRENTKGNIESQDPCLQYEFDEVWGLPCRQLADYPAPQDGYASESNDRSMLRTAFYTFLHSLVKLKPVAAQSLDLSLSSGSHDPAMALFLTFARLFAKAQDRANQFTARHRDFYYKDVLGVKPRPGFPDSTFLVFEGAAGSGTLQVPAGTEFTAGKAADGAEIVYRSNENLQVADVNVRVLRTLQCERDPLISPEKELGFVNAMRVGELVRVPAPPPIFGDDSATRHADIGFAVACSSLLMSEGKRDVEVTLRFRIPRRGVENLGTLMRRLILGSASSAQEAAYKDLVASPKTKNTNDLLAQDRREIFQRVFGSAFLIDLTTTSGWYAVAHYEALPPKTTGDVCSLVLKFELGPDVPAVTPWNLPLHGAGFDTGLPVLRFRLNPDAVVYPYSLLEGLGVEQVSVECTVFDATNVVAWNQHGRLDTTKPFLPFGPLPGSNSWLVLGNYDSARTHLTDLRFNLEWADLPADFAVYYNGYGNAYSPDVFVANMSSLRDGRWLPSGTEAIQAPLLNTEQSFRPLIDKKYVQTLDPKLTDEQFLFDQKARNGFVRLALAGPPYGFGHVEYPSLLTEVLSDNAHTSRWHRRTPRALPNPPYTPVINRVTATYSSKSTIAPGAGPSTAADGAQERYFRIHPFGVETVDTSKAWDMLPAYDCEGNLFIGLSSSQPRGILTLLFQLREDSSTSVADAQPAIWHYLASDRWQAFGPRNILSDTTEGFLCSGIVTLALPDSLTLEHSSMPSGLYWIRVSARVLHRSFSGIYAVQAQAVSATRRLPKRDFGSPLPAGAISGPVISIPGLRKVSQPLSSFGGERSETEQNMIARASGRLRHRYRASSPWDYERLVLENFPEVFKVKCFPAMATPKSEPVRSKPGSVMVVVVPYPRQKGTLEVMAPMMDAIRLKRIHEFLEDVKSPFAQVEVRNPVYDQVMVSCTIALASDAAQHWGKCLVEINQAIVDYFSPWSPIGPKPRFGWHFANREVEAFIRKLDNVVGVADFSLLRITHDDGRATWQLADTARTPVSRGVSWHYPWSLAIPAPKHNLNVTLAGVPAVLASPAFTGIGRMEVGKTFIITQ